MAMKQTHDLPHTRQVVCEGVNILISSRTSGFIAKISVCCVIEGHCHKMKVHSYNTTYHMLLLTYHG